MTALSPVWLDSRSRYIAGYVSPGDGDGAVEPGDTQS